VGGGVYYYITTVNVKVETSPPPQAEQKPRPDTFGDPNKSRHVQFPGQPANPSAPKQ
jgi:hypothetical protein